MDLVRVRGFGKRYRRVVTVDGVDVDISRGEIFGLIGPDGAGKSSLMKAVAGVLSFERGRVEVFGVALDSEANAERVKDRIGFMPQGLGLNLYPDLSIDENIDFLASLRQVPPTQLAERKQRLLAMTRLTPFRERAMKHLSGGMKQKLGLVCTLIHEPELVILDEPTTGVDPLSRRDFWSILTELLRDRGITALISTAYLDEASRFHRLALMHRGQVLDRGLPDEIVARVGGSLVSLRVIDQPAALRRLRAHFEQVEARGSRLRVFVPEADHGAARARVAGVLEGLEIDDLDVDEPELEDAFISLLADRRGDGDAQRSLPEMAALDAEQGGATRDDEVMIEARDLCRDFGAFRAVDHVSFRVRRGEIFGLLGANGAGKTTVIKMLTGILPPSAGGGRIAGIEMRGGKGAAALAIRQRIGYMSQAFSLYQDLSAIENIRLYAGIQGLHGAALRDRIAWVLELAGLQGYETARAGRLPMGLRQRLALGCALVHQPRVLFLDEPTSGVDPLGRRRFWEILLDLSRRQGVTILITTHYMSEAEHCDRLALMHAGHLVADETPDALREGLQREAGRLLELRVDQPLDALRLLEGHYQGVSLHGARIHLFAPSREAAEADIRARLTAAGLRLIALREREAGMEDVFVYRMRALEREAAA